MRAHLATVLLMSSCFSPALPAATFDWFEPRFPEATVPATSYAEPIAARAYSVYGPAKWNVQVRIDVSCGTFDGLGSSMIATGDNDGWITTGYLYRAPSQPQDCTITFTEVDGTATLTMPLVVYDPAAAIMAPDLAAGIQTEASRPFELALTFTTASGRPISNNMIMVLPYAPQGASAEVDFAAVTNGDGTRYVSGLSNNAVGQYELVVDLQNVRRWRIPVSQGTPLPGARKHFGSM